MSRVLVIGGTRFVGRLTAQALAARHDVLVLSRNPGPVEGGKRLVADRLDGLRQLLTSRFDVVLDFIAYDEQGVAEAGVLAETYIAISSTWMARLESRSIPIPDVTRMYLMGKTRLEDATRQLRVQGRSATAVRLPILLGEGDHTGRLDFYRSRIADGSPLLLVDGGVNTAQLLWSQDAARLLVALVESGKAARHAVWEALPDEGHPVVESLEDMARVMGRTLEAVSAPGNLLEKELPGYLDIEPLWRESAIPRTAANVFLELGLKPTPAAEWLASLPETAACSHPGRQTEIALARRLTSSAR